RYTYPDHSKIGRINLTDEGSKQKTEQESNVILEKNIQDRVHLVKLIKNTQDSEYRLSTQPSIWNREFLLQYLKPNLTPWEFETQESKNGGWIILGAEKGKSPVVHNEGVTKHNLYKYDLSGIDQK